MPLGVQRPWSSPDMQRWCRAAADSSRWHEECDLSVCRSALNSPTHRDSSENFRLNPKHGGHIYERLTMAAAVGVDAAASDSGKNDAKALKPFYDHLENVDEGKTGPLAAHLALQKAPSDISQMIACLKQATPLQLELAGRCQECLRVFAQWLQLVKGNERIACNLISLLGIMPLTLRAASTSGVLVALGLFRTGSTAAAQEAARALHSRLHHQERSKDAPGTVSKGRKGRGGGVATGATAQRVPGEGVVRKAEEAKADGKTLGVLKINDQGLIEELDEDVLKQLPPEEVRSSL
jgi:hypothetical protein